MFSPAGRPRRTALSRAADDQRITLSAETEAVLRWRVPARRKRGSLPTFRGGLLGRPLTILHQLAQAEAILSGPPTIAAKDAPPVAQRTSPNAPRGARTRPGGWGQRVDYCTGARRLSEPPRPLSQARRQPGGGQPSARTDEQLRRPVREGRAKDSAEVGSNLGRNQSAERRDVQGRRRRLLRVAGRERGRPLHRAPVDEAPADI